MKKGIWYLSTALLIVAFSISSCGDDDSEPSDPNELYGVWYLQGFLHYSDSDDHNRDVAGSKFYFKKDGTLQEAGMLYMESDGAGKEMVPYPYSISDGRLYIVSPFFNYNKEEKLIWYFER